MNSKLLIMNAVFVGHSIFFVNCMQLSTRKEPSPSSGFICRQIRTTRLISRANALQEEQPFIAEKLRNDKAYFNKAVEFCQSGKFLGQFLFDPQSCEQKYHLSQESKELLKPAFDLAFLNCFMPGMYKELLIKNISSEFIDRIFHSPSGSRLVIACRDPWVIYVYDHQTKQLALCSGSEDKGFKKLLWKDDEHLLGITNYPEQSYIIVWKIGENFCLSIKSLKLNQSILCASFACDSDDIYCITITGAILVWHFLEDTYEQSTQLQYIGVIVNAVFSTQGSSKLLITEELAATQRTIVRWRLIDVKQHKEILSDFFGLENRAGLNSDELTGKIIAWQDGPIPKFTLFDWVTGEKGRSYEMLSNYNKHFSFSYDGSQLLIIKESPNKPFGEFVFYDLQSHEKLEKFSKPDIVDFQAIAHPHDLMWVLLTSKVGNSDAEKESKILSLRDSRGEIVRMLEDDPKIQAMQFSPCGKWLVVAVGNGIIKYPIISFKNDRQACTFEQLMLLLSMRFKNIKINVFL